MTNPPEDNLKQIRWKQRFDNFTRAYLLLERTVQIENPSEAEKGGLIQFFEVSFELAWKTLKDFMESKGVSAAFPREVLKKAFNSGIIDNGHLWLEALEDRNRTTHIYNEEVTDAVVARIRNEYYPMLKELYLFFTRESEKDHNDQRFA